ncbi:uncharacterized protein Fot_51567 [Forsythia ovata]|uniref:Uncharacterized protein n=1 Tax=Forsythia ovata TaxID=205694 RepID=A0ABD1PVV8_9LAMI
MEEIRESTNGRQNRDAYFVQNPCSYFEVAIKTLLKCLGFESGEPKNSSTSEEKDNKDGDETTSSQNPDPPADPPSPAADPPADPSASTTMAIVGRTPPRPPIGGGRGGQTN